MKETINEKFKELTTVTIKVTLPMSIWEEWNADCVDNFNGTRYLKMKLDHDFRKQFKSVGELIIEDLEELRQRVAELELVIADMEMSKKRVSKTLTFAERRALKENE
jgi:hypothetical protein